MRKKILALSLGILFFGSVASSTFAAPVLAEIGIVKIDDDKNKTKAKATTTTATAKEAKKGDCATKSECCSSKAAASCADKKEVEKK